MKWGELKALMEGKPDECDIIMATDDEGNSFDTIGAVERNRYILDIDGYVELVDVDDDEYDNESVDCVVFWPEG